MERKKSNVTNRVTVYLIVDYFLYTIYNNAICIFIDCELIECGRVRKVDFIGQKGQFLNSLKVKKIR